MKVTIDIPEYVYEHAKDGSEDSNDEWIVMRAIAKAEPTAEVKQTAFDIEEIITGLKFTVDMFLFDPNTGEKYTEPRNNMDKITVDACRGAIEALEQETQVGWIPVSERLPEKDGCYLVTTTGTNNDIIDIAYYTNGICIWHKASRIKAWMPLPEPYKEESEVG